jgi:hypothetical protein
VERNPFGFFMLLALTIWVAYTVVRAFRTGDIYSRGMYTFRRDESPFLYWTVLLAHAGIVIGFGYALTTFE